MFAKKAKKDGQESKLATAFKYAGAFVTGLGSGDSVAGYQAAECIIQQTKNLRYKLKKPNNDR